VTAAVSGVSSEGCTCPLLYAAAAELSLQRRVWRFDG
jgi:hypothetical protein